MLAWLTKVYEQAQEPPNAEAIAFNPREIRGGGDMFIVAPDCEAWVDIHAAPGIQAADVAGLIERGRGLAARTHANCDFDCEAIFAAEGYEVADADGTLTPLKQAFEAAGVDWTPAAFRSHSDAPMFRGAGSVPVVCGPGKLEVAHTRTEHVSLSETLTAARLYAALIHAACIA
jgi:acetylornithine deacetylase